MGWQRKRRPLTYLPCDSAEVPQGEDSEEGSGWVKPRHPALLPEKRDETCSDPMATPKEHQGERNNHSSDIMREAPQFGRETLFIVPGLTSLIPMTEPP